MPKASIVSPVDRSPAVSMKRKSTPSMLSTSSTVSRVVPCISLTMARSSPKRALSKVLFPTFVAPAIATGIPRLMAFPRRKLSVRSTIFSVSSSRSSRSCVRSAKVTSSSLKSSSSSMRLVRYTSCSRSCANSALYPPLNCARAMRCCASDSEAIRSATASARLRSILPCR